jgi:hypothetical protein
LIQNRREKKIIIIISKGQRMVLWFRKKRKEKDKNYCPIDSCDLLSEKKRQNKEKKKKIISKVKPNNQSYDWSSISQHQPEALIDERRPTSQRCGRIHLGKCLHRQAI